jgi:2,3-dihydroxybenzoate decarboxylase
MHTPPPYVDSHVRQIKSITDERLQLLDAYGVGYTTVALTVPSIQGNYNKEEAEAHATEVNDYTIDKIKDRRKNFGAFACLSMHDPAQAAQKLRRCVTWLGFHGALLCNFQHSGLEGETYLFYDQPPYDVFWEACMELDVPLYTSWCALQCTQEAIVHRGVNTWSASAQLRQRCLPPPSRHRQQRRFRPPPIGQDHC